MLEYDGVEKSFHKEKKLITGQTNRRKKLTWSQAVGVILTSQQNMDAPKID